LIAQDRRITGALLGLLTTLKACRRATNAICRKTRKRFSLRTIKSQNARSCGGRRIHEVQRRAIENWRPIPRCCHRSRDYLVHQGIPFRQAHDIVGKCCAKPRNKIFLDALPLETLKKSRRPLRLILQAA